MLQYPENIRTAVNKQGGFKTNLSSTLCLQQKSQHASCTLAEIIQRTNRRKTPSHREITPDLPNSFQHTNHKNQAAHNAKVHT